MQNRTLGARRLEGLTYGISAVCREINLKNNYKWKDLEYQKCMTELDKCICVSSSTKQNNHLRDWNLSNKPVNFLF